jgi:hypothetical protein
MVPLHRATSLNCPVAFPARCCLQTSHKQAERNLQRTTQNLQGAIEAISRLEADLQGSSDR